MIAVPLEETASLAVVPAQSCNVSLPRPLVQRWGSASRLLR